MYIYIYIWLSWLYIYICNYIYIWTHTDVQGGSPWFWFVDNPMNDRMDVAIFDVAMSRGHEVRWKSGHLDHCNSIPEKWTMVLEYWPTTSSPWAFGRNVDKYSSTMEHIPWRIRMYAILMVCHGHHQYTPVMLASIYHTTGSVMGWDLNSSARSFQGGRTVYDRNPGVLTFHQNSSRKFPTVGGFLPPLWKISKFVN